jgi:hypothetical protein
VRSGCSPLREERTGSWRDINGGGSTDPITRRYLTLWSDHGADPDAESYAYVLVPGASATRTAELAADPGTEIIANTADVQAVRVPRLGIVATNFWDPGSSGEVTVDAACSIMIRERAGTLTVAVSDPTHLRDSLSIEIARHGYQSLTGDETITVQAMKPAIRFQVDTSSANGTTHHVTFRRS